ncbi:hypothetical protein [Pseudomonas sp.]|uniref:hypothetical protein n=1 Tax=Pseudomonas sp. TaxID=306 RepID=UPI002620628A|nr:hypothetical protein [Pseudomonas sp.]
MTEATLIRRLRQKAEAEGEPALGVFWLAIDEAIEVIRAAFAAERKRAQRRGALRVKPERSLRERGLELDLLGTARAAVSRKRNQPKGGADK